jgi:hypothetical protein
MTGPEEKWRATTDGFQDSRCGARTKNGKPCCAATTEGGLCFFHANPNKAVQLVRIGAKKNGHLQVGLDPLPNLDNAMAIRDTVARLISDVCAGKLHPRIAAGLAPLMHHQTRYYVSLALLTCLQGSPTSTTDRVSQAHALCTFFT